MRCSQCSQLGVAAMQHPCFQAARLPQGRAIGTHAYLDASAGHLYHNQMVRTGCFCSLHSMQKARV